jgi:hypothetical protein
MPEKVAKFSALDLLLTLMKRKKRKRKEQFDGAENIGLIMKRPCIRKSCSVVSGD